MTPLITVVLAGATSLLTLAIAMASGRVFSSLGWLVPYLVVASCLLYLLAALLAILHWQKERQREKNSSSPALPTISIKQEASPQISHTVVIHKDVPIPPERTKAQQHDYDKARDAIKLLGEKSVIALRYLRGQESITFDFGGCTGGSLPSGLTAQNALWVYRHCASEGILSCKKSLGNHEETYTVPSRMTKILDAVLFEN
ncbi:MAG TPA: hypothetical protein VK722_02590 [Candidatus Aquilonibacter sp.]|jgi:hypothetical protein|nr:hypothetical protein [Candidatus Aquilonibacter sp.]